MISTEKTTRARAAAPWAISAVFGVFLAGCASAKPDVAALRPFRFERDTFAYANELVWEYRFDEQGHWTHRKREPPPEYSHHCFVVARAAKQFFLRARFDPTQPEVDDKTYSKLVRRVVSANPSRELPPAERIVIPGYSDLREFSADQKTLLQENCGGAWRSYFQRGHWRMIFPFSRRHQAKTATQLAESIQSNRPVVVHVVCFPSLRINHAVLLFEVKDEPDRIEFSTYDPNAPDQPTTLTYDRATRTFRFPTNFYFPGGDVDVYEIYRSACY